MSKRIEKLDITKMQNETPFGGELNEDLLAAQELEDIEGGWCDYSCVACTSSGLIDL